jgi:phosphate transport system protein
MPESTSPALAPHTSSEFDEKLTQAHALVMQMGARARRQLDDAIECLRTGDAGLAEQILRHEVAINALERSIDASVEQIIARRQPAAADLRLLTTLLKVTTDLERIGDEAKKIALQARRLHAGGSRRLPRGSGIGRMGALAGRMLVEALDRLERMDARDADRIVARDAELNQAYRAALRALITFMIEDPRTISDCLDLTVVAKSLERIGDHAKNIAGHVVYAHQGADVRHLSDEEVARAIRERSSY